LRSWVTQLRKGLLEYCILAVLESDETYGYQLIQRLRGMEDLTITESTAYPILNRLREDGYVKVRTAPSLDGPPRRYYSLTRLGKCRVREMHSYWDALTESIRGLRGIGRSKEGHEDG